MAATMTRTDIHRMGSDDFNPENYSFFGVFDTATDAADFMGPTPVATVSSLVSEGWSFTGAPHGSRQCSHCGTRLRYVALMGFAATKTLMYIGETCLDNRFSLTLGEFQALREATAAKRTAQAKQERFVTALAEHPLLVWASYAHNIGVVGGVEIAYDYYEGTEYADEAAARAAGVPDAALGIGYRQGTTWSEQTRMGAKITTLSDMWHRFERYADFSDNAYAYLTKILGWMDDAETKRAARAAEAETKIAAGVSVPTGKTTVTGVVKSTKYVDGFNSWSPSVLKMTVETTEGYRLYGTVPSAINTVEAGDTVTFTATLEPSKDDALFGFYKRPSKASIA